VQLDLNQEFLRQVDYGNKNILNRFLPMLWIVRILLTLSAALAARFLGHDVLDFGFGGTAVVFVIIIGFAVWATERTIRHDP